MKTLIQLFLTIYLILGLSNCNATKQEVYQLQNKTPFIIKKATYQEWVAGIRGGGAGITIILEVEELNSERINFFVNFFY